ncbi:hypothetical protein KUCAC02_032248, partial [Chaenocephalus aceratus]
MADAVEENVKPKTEEKPDDSGSEEDNSQPEVAEIEVALKTFKDLGVTEVLCEACDQLGWKTPTKIQIEAVPLALQGRDIIGLAETGSGKTGAFALPILQSLLSFAPEGCTRSSSPPPGSWPSRSQSSSRRWGASIGVKC